MSFLSGKHDLLDSIGFNVQRHKDGSLYKTGDEYNVLYSDLFECYKEFKRKTNGTLYQYKNIKVTENNAEFIASKCSDFKIIEHKETKLDNRTKSGSKEVITYTYEYYGKEYTLKELDKKGGVYITVEIKFNNLIELIPYLPRIVYVDSCIDQKEIVYISDESYAEEKYNKSLQFGYEATLIDHYRSELANLYKDVILNYYNPKEEDIIITEAEFKEVDGKYIYKTDFEIDDEFDVEWYWKDGKCKTHWTSPQKLDSRTIEMSKQDYENYLGSKQMIKYIRKYDRPLILS